MNLEWLDDIVAARPSDFGKPSGASYITKEQVRLYRPSVSAAHRQHISSCNGYLSAGS
jgi:hypothetical protein